MLDLEWGEKRISGREGSVSKDLEVRASLEIWGLREVHRSQRGPSPGKSQGVLGMHCAFQLRLHQREGGSTGARSAVLWGRHSSDRLGLSFVRSHSTAHGRKSTATGLNLRL